MHLLQTGDAHAPHPPNGCPHPVSPIRVSLSSVTYPGVPIQCHLSRCRIHATSTIQVSLSCLTYPGVPILPQAPGRREDIDIDICTQFCDTQKKRIRCVSVIFFLAIRLQSVSISLTVYAHRGRWISIWMQTYASPRISITVMICIQIHTVCGVCQAGARDRNCFDPVPCSTHGYRYSPYRYLWLYYTHS